MSAKVQAQNCSEYEQIWHYPCPVQILRNYPTGKKWSSDSESQASVTHTVVQVERNMFIRMNEME